MFGKILDFICTCLHSAENCIGLTVARPIANIIFVCSLFYTFAIAHKFAETEI